MGIDIYSRMYTCKNEEDREMNFELAYGTTCRFKVQKHNPPKGTTRRSKEFSNETLCTKYFSSCGFSPPYNPRNSHATKFQSLSASCPVSPRFSIPRVPFDVSVSYQPFSTSITPATDAPRTLGFPTPSPTPFAAPSSFSRHRRVPFPRTYHPF